MNCYRSLYIIPGTVLTFLLCIGLPAVVAQNKPLIKPRPLKVEDRRPPSEILAAKPWTIKRKLMQNMVTRYNYYYHARTKLNTVVKQVSRQGQDNYNALLPFYPFNVQNLGLSKTELDSVVEIASIGIQLHDPRSKWIDDCFLLMGRAYFYEGDLENANKTFQYINTTYAPKKKSDYKVVIGANENDQFSIASREKRKGFLGRFKHIYARNDAFLWRARTLLEAKDFDEAQALLNLLVTDPHFPKRLEGDLAEVMAYSHYKQGRYGETIEPLKLAIRKSHDRVSKTRMSYILGQLYAQQQRPDSALDQFRDVIGMKPDPTMDFHARLEIARLNTQVPGGSVEQSIAALQRMLRKERFVPYRDGILYTMAALVADKDPDAAIGYLQRSLKAESENTIQRTLTYKAMADVYFSQRKYLDAKNYYDSTAGIMGPDFVEAELVNTRKSVLTEVAGKIAIIQKEDSLRRIAAMPEATRNTFLEQMAAGMKKTATVKKQEEAMRASNPFDAPNMDAFAPKAEKGDWYFYNVASKSTGYSDFKRRWGNRQLNDNWRRSQTGVVNASQNNSAVVMNDAPGAASKENVPPDSISAALLAEGLPLTEAKRNASLASEMDAWFDLGKLYHDKLDHHQLAIETYDSLLFKFPGHPNKPEVLYSLYVWHNQLNHTAEANRYKDMVMQQHGNTNFAQIIRFGGLKDIDAEKKKAITQAYDSAYTAFRSGDYTGALQRKRLADSTFGFNFLQPKFDLLEAMVIMKLDTVQYASDSASAARTAVMAVMDKYPADEQVRAQAQSLLDALSHKNELVTYLAQLQLQKQNDQLAVVDENISIRYPWQNPTPAFRDSIGLKINRPDSLQNVVAKIGGATPPPLKTVAPPKPVTPYKLMADKADNPHFVVLSFVKVSKALMDEGLNQFTRYNASKHATDKIEVGSFVLTPNDMMLIFRLFPNEDKALAYFDEIRDEATANIIPRIRPTDYTMFVISRDNFILLNSTKDLEGYRKFFSDNYITQ